jgi:signal transduction histidine kinase
VAHGDPGVFDRLIPAALLASHETRLRATTLAVGSLGLAVLALATSIVRMTTAPFDVNLVVLLVTVVMLAVLPVVQHRSGSYRLPAGVLVVFLMITLPGYAVTLAVFPVPALLMFPIIPLLATFFLGRAPGLACALVLAAAALVLGSTLPTPDPTLLAMLSRTFISNAAIATLMAAHLAWAYEGARLRYEAELRAMNAALDEARQAAEAANRGKTEFLQHVSHELRTPLNSIVGFGELLREELAAGGQDRLVADVVLINDASQHILSLINELLDISRIEAGAIDLEVSAVDVAALATRVADAMRPLATERRNALTLALADGLAPVATDPRRLRQVLLNLIGNACKFTERGEITLGVEAAADGVDVWVRDTGSGMTPAQLARIFDPFVQVDASAERRAKGSGLGLAITRRLVELLGGGITVSSEPGRGSEFRVSLPRRAAAPP